MHYKIGICDDDDKYIEIIRNVICEYYKDSNTFEIYTFNSGKELLEHTEQLDIIFLDIEINGSNGIELKDKMSRYINLRIIFVTNHENYMNDAYGKNVVGYINKNEIFKITDLLKKFELEDRENEFIMLEGHNINISDIIYISADGNYINIYLAKTKSQVCLCVYLKDFLQRLPFCFVRVHRSYVVNLKYVRDVNRTKIILRNELQIPVSKSYHDNFLKTYFEYRQSEL